MASSAQTMRFALAPALQGLLLAEQADDQATNGAEVRRAMAVLLAGGVFVEGHIEYPVLTILDAPMLANGLTQRLGGGLRSLMNIRVSHVSSPPLVTHDVARTSVRKSRHLCRCGWSRGIPIA